MAHLEALSLALYPTPTYSRCSMDHITHESSESALLSSPLPPAQREEAPSAPLP
ncbi:hypothetical protein DSO57_1030369 [Entomophthora muscae]|uniref:Uncharacterized protein n=1 Tax=Entomophthora muscae TaxID=34485 RepID=A0ACC2SQ84_9FUNG|nr:hypothetical protein DSO57_1030369 [Entomophthora muscae]